MPTAYDRRLEEEWRSLGLLASLNTSVIEVVSRVGVGHVQAFTIRLRNTMGLVAARGDLTAIADHEATFFFPRFFPSTPIEASLRTPVFHPNVHPENGFVCIWGRFSAGQTVIHALERLRGVITWTLVNEQEYHVMQPEALAWYLDERAIQIPLSCQLLVKPGALQGDFACADHPPISYRRRLQ
jgi:Ubiquitin-conjugating enzyme